MRKISLALLLVCTTVGAFAQTSAIMSLESGVLNKAKEDIDKAMLDEKANKKAKTWHYAGKIYEAIAIDNTGLYGKLDSSSAFKAYSFYKKAMEVEPEAKINKDTKEAMTGQKLYSGLMTQGAAKYQTHDFATAYKLMNLAGEINPKDTTSQLYSGVVAQQLKDNDLTLKHFEKYAKLGGRDYSIFYSIALIYKGRNDIDKAIASLDKGIALHPNNKDLKSEKINMYISSGKAETAMAELKKMLENDPKNVQSALNIAILADNAGKKDEAKEYYTKALAIDSKNYDANFNMGVFYYNEAVALKSTIDKMDMKEYKEKGKVLEGKVCGKFKKALPYFEAAKAVKEEIDLMENLKNLQNVLKQFEDRKTVCEE